MKAKQLASLGNRPPVDVGFWWRSYFKDVYLAAQIKKIYDARGPHRLDSLPS
jgi:hypothetical protein